MEQSKVRELQDVVIRFSGDSGDGMQLTGTLGELTVHVRDIVVRTRNEEFV